MPEESEQQRFSSPKDAKAAAAAEKAYKKAQRPWFKKKRILLPLIVVALIVLVAITGGGGEEGPSATGGGSDDSGPPTAPPFPGAEKDDVAVQAGEEVDADGVKITAAPLEAGDSTLEPTLCSAVKYINESDKAASFNGGFDWKMQDPNGVTLSNSFSGSDNMLSSGELAPGGTLNADVCFTAPQGAPSGQYVILLDPTFRFSSDRIAWLNQR